MSSFIQKNKKKGILAALLYSLQQGKGGLPVLVGTALILSFLSMPGGTLMSIPGASFVAEKMGVAGFFRATGSERLEIFRQALHNSRGTPEEIRRRMRAERSDTTRSDRSRVKLVSGGYLTQYQRRQTFDNVGQSRGKSIQGILTPTDASKVADALPIQEEKFEQALIGTAFTEAIRQEDEGTGSYNATKGGAGATDSGGVGDSGLLIKSDSMAEKAVNDNSDVVNEALLQTKTPGTGRGRKAAEIRGRSRHMRGSRRMESRTRSVASASNGDASVMYQLTVARAFSVAAAKTETDADGGHLMKDTAGLIFDGGREPGNKSSLGGDSGGGGAGISGGDLESLKEQAEKREGDIEKCQDADRTHGAAQRQAMEKTQKYAKSDLMPKANECIDKRTHRDRMQSKYNSLWGKVKKFFGNDKLKPAKRAYNRCVQEFDQKGLTFVSYCEEANREGVAKRDACPIAVEDGRPAPQIDCAGELSRYRSMF